MLRNAPNYSSVLKLTNLLSSSEAGKTPLQLTRSICDVEVFSHFTVRVTFTTFSKIMEKEKKKTSATHKLLRNRALSFHSLFAAVNIVLQVDCDW